MKTTDDGKIDSTLPDVRPGGSPYDRLLRNILVEAERNSLVERGVRRRWAWRIGGMLLALATVAAVLMLRPPTGPRFETTPAPVGGTPAPAQSRPKDVPAGLGTGP